MWYFFEPHRNIGHIAGYSLWNTALLHNHQKRKTHINPLNKKARNINYGLFQYQDRALESPHNLSENIITVCVQHQTNDNEEANIVCYF